MSAVKRGNGGVVGAENTTTTIAASGIWGLNEVLEARKNNLWPTIGLYNYPIEQSLRFDGSSYLSRTPTTASNRNTWTWSGWVKFSNPNIGGAIFRAGTADTNGTGFSHLGSSLNLEAAFQFYTILSGTDYGWNSTLKLRDPSAWYHIVAIYDSANVGMVAYINGVQINSFATDYGSLPANTDSLVNATNLHTIGRHQSLAQSYHIGYMANIHFIDGQALSPYFFGELIGGVWTPKTFDGTASDGNTGSATNSYGTNGFHLIFAPDTVDTVSSPNRFLDQSPNSNHWDIY